MPIYHKLIRDKIPKTIEDTGKQCTSKILSNDEYIKTLQKKVLRNSRSTSIARITMRQLADLLEIIHSFAEYHGVSINKIEESRKRKPELRGGFKDKFFN